jgi:hypothetical protein
MNTYRCPYCDNEFSDSFINKLIGIESEVGYDTLFENAPCCNKEMTVYFHKGQLSFRGLNRKEAYNEELEQFYYPEGRKDPVDKPQEIDQKIGYDELLRQHNDEKGNISYASLLQTNEWRDKRNQIIKRDKNRCTKCLKRETVYYPYNSFSFSAEKWTGHFWIEDTFDLKQYQEYETGYDKLMDETGFFDTMAIIISDKQYYLQVHHKHYILNRLPWEYDDEELITLCNWCHWEFHENHEVEVYKDSNGKLEPVMYTICGRCNGAGWFPEYWHVEGGVCFECRGQPYSLG